MISKARKPFKMCPQSTHQSADGYHKATASGSCTLHLFKRRFGLGSSEMRNHNSWKGKGKEAAEVIIILHSVHLR